MVETLGQEMFLLASQAADLIERLPINEVSTTEYLAVAGALFETGKSLHKAADILSRAESVATDPIERNVALRNNARYLIRSGQSEEGRLKYQQAIDLVENLALNGPSMPVYKAYTNAETLLYEVEDELFTGDCTAAAKTFAEARKRLEFSPNHIDVRYRDYLNGRTIELQSNLTTCNGSPPSIGVPPHPPIGTAVIPNRTPLLGINPMQGQEPDVSSK